MFKQSEQQRFVKCARRSAWRGDLPAICAWLVLLGVATTARGQCLEGHLFASDGAPLDQFGFAAALFGDTAVVGVPSDDTSGGTDSGSVYVFIRSSGVWTQQAHLFAPAGAPEDFFGVSVAISDDTAIVGAPRDDTPAGANAGSAYVFVRVGGVWTQQAHLVAPDGAAIDRFGQAVGISNDTVVVGAWSDDTPAGTDAGSIYVFVRAGTVWTEQAHLYASDATAGDFFSSFAVAIDGDTIVVGASNDDKPGEINAGSAYVFVRSEDVWSEQDHLFASDGAAADFFGAPVSISGDTVIVGAIGDDTPDGADAGSAYVFVRSGGVWTEQAQLFAPDGAAGDNFGWSAISGDTAVVSAFLDDTPGGTDAGSAYVFERIGDVWTEQAHLYASDGATGDQLGYSVAISGDTAVVGANWDDTPGGADAGSAYVFDLGCTPGDLNCDNAVDMADVPHFIDALLATGFTGCDINRADVNSDGLINGRDMQPFVAMLIAP